MVVLHECAGDPELGEGRHRIDLGEPTTGIAKTLWADELDKVGHKDTYTEVKRVGEANYLLKKKCVGEISSIHAVSVR